MKRGQNQSLLPDGRGREKVLQGASRGKGAGVRDARGRTPRAPMHTPAAASLAAGLDLKRKRTLPARQPVRAVPPGFSPPPQHHQALPRRFRLAKRHCAPQGCARCTHHIFLASPSALTLTRYRPVCCTSSRAWSLSYLPRTSLNCITTLCAARCKCGQRSVGYSAALLVHAMNQCITTLCAARCKCGPSKLHHHDLWREAEPRAEGWAKQAAHTTLCELGRDLRTGVAQAGCITAHEREAEAHATRGRCGAGTTVTTPLRVHGREATTCHHTTSCPMHRPPAIWQRCTL